MMNLLKIVLLISISHSDVCFAESFEQKLVKAAIERTQHNVVYDGSYFAIDYPNGDVPSNIGVCTDLIIRSYRALGIDLQQLVHQDMKQNFSLYPSKSIWGLKRTDKNIDHRRVPNLQVFFNRHGQAFPISLQKENYLAGDIVTWLVSGSLPHIVIAEKSEENGNPLIVHNVGLGPQKEDMLFDFKITGHYRFNPKKP